MATILEIPLSDVKPATLKAWQSKYPHATLRIETDAARHGMTMDEEQFWVLIGMLDWKQFDRATIMFPAVVALSRFSEDDIHLFHDILRVHEKTRQLERKRRRASPL